MPFVLAVPVIPGLTGNPFLRGRWIDWATWIPGQAGNDRWGKTGMTNRTGIGVYSRKAGGSGTNPTSGDCGKGLGVVAGSGRGAITPMAIRLSRLS